MKPELIDNFIQFEFGVEDFGKDNENFFISKPEQFEKKYTSSWDRFKLGWEVFRGRAVAIRFKEDEIKK